MCACVRACVRVCGVWVRVCVCVVYVLHLCLCKSVCLWIYLPVLVSGYYLPFVFVESKFQSVAGAWEVHP